MLETATSSDGTTIAFERSGAGTSLIFIGGAFNDRKTPTELSTILSAEFEVVRYDRRGRGDSSDTVPYAREREIEDLAAVIDAIGEPVLVYGHSSGAGLGLLAAAAQLPIAALALYEAPYFLPGDRAEIPAGFAEDLAQLVADDRRGDAVERFMTTAIGLPPPAVEYMRGQPFWPSLEAISHTLPYDIQVMGDNRVPEQEAAGVEIPVLVLVGGNSGPWFANSAAALASALPNGSLQTIEGQDHDVRPDVIAPVLTAFFSSRPPAIPT